MTETRTESPTWGEYCRDLYDRDLIAAGLLLQVDPHRVVLRDAARWLAYDHDDTPVLDWAGWISDVTTEGRGWSSTEHRLFALVAALADDRPVQLTGCMDRLGSWQADATEVLAAWAGGR